MSEPESDDRDVVIKDAAYFQDVRRALGRGAPSVLFGTSNRTLDRSVARAAQAAQGQVTGAGDALPNDAERQHEGWAEAVIEERHLLRALRWWDGFVIALCSPAFFIAAFGFSLRGLGTWGAFTLWAVAAAVGMLQTWIYAETATMFPDKPGGISLYAHEGWRGRFILAGPVGACGYWIGWSVALSIFGKIIGDLIEANWFPTASWSFFDGTLHLGLAHFIAIGCIVVVSLLSICGARPAVWVSYVTGAGLLVLLGIFIIGPYASGNWRGSNMSWTLHGWPGFKTAIVWLFLMSWSVYRAEIPATFAAEYRGGPRDTTLALRTAGVFTLMATVLFALGAAGTTSVPSAADAEGQFYAGALAKIVGSGAAGVIVVLLIGGLFLSMLSSTAGASRALYGMARDDMTVKQLYHLNRFHVPARAITVNLVVNVLLVLFVASNLAIVYVSSIGYILAHVLALSGFLLLRKDRPNWPRPIRVGGIWVGIAAVLVVYNIILIGFGVTNPALTGYGTFADVWIAVGVLVGSVVLFFYRRLVQDKAKVTFREEVPTEPAPEQMALLREEGAVRAD